MKGDFKNYKGCLDKDIIKSFEDIEKVAEENKDTIQAILKVANNQSKENA